MHAQDGIAPFEFFAGAKLDSDSKVPTFKQADVFLKFWTKWGSKTKNSRTRVAREARKIFATRKFIALRSA